jgi:D-alanyl-D-alanine carboxypeptidase
MMPPMRSLLLAALLATSCAGGKPAPAPAIPAAPALTEAQTRLAADLDAAVRRAIEGKPMAGLSVAVVVDGTTVLARGYGLAEVAAARPAAADTIYRIGSITKTFTAALILQLAAAGKVGLDQPITRYLPDYDTHGATITVRHLLTHTSGMMTFTVDQGKATGLQAEQSGLTLHATRMP